MKKELTHNGLTKRTMKSIYLALYLIIHADICFFSRTQLLFFEKAHIFKKPSYR